MNYKRTVSAVLLNIEKGDFAMKKNTAETVFELVQPYAQNIGLEIYDVEFVKEGSSYFLRIYIDKPDGCVSSDDCEKMSRLIDPVLDEADPIDTSYYLEVSSVGLDRPLKLEKDFLRFMGEKIDVRLFKSLDGMREFVGTLTGYEKGTFTVILASGQTLTLEQKQASLIRPHIDF